MLVFSKKVFSFIVIILDKVIDGTTKWLLKHTETMTQILFICRKIAYVFNFFGMKLHKIWSLLSDIKITAVYFFNCLFPSIHTLVSIRFDGGIPHNMIEIINLCFYVLRVKLQSNYSEYMRIFRLIHRYIIKVTLFDFF